jgi:hypothetical protein
LESSFISRSLYRMTAVEAIMTSSFCCVAQNSSRA